MKSDLDTRHWQPNSRAQCGLINKDMGMTYLADRLSETGETIESALDHIYTIFNLFSYFRTFSNIFQNICNAPLPRLSWRPEIYRPKDFRGGAFSICPSLLRFSYGKPVNPILLNQPQSKVGQSQLFRDALFVRIYWLKCIKTDDQRF